jgi:hypothetical protein
MIHKQLTEKELKNKIYYTFGSRIMHYVLSLLGTAWYVWVIQYLSHVLKERIFISRVHKFSKNLGSTSKFSASERWYETSYVLRTHNSGEIYKVTVIWRLLFGACALIYICVCKGKFVVIVMKIRAATVQNLVAQATGISAPLDYTHKKTRHIYSIQRCVTCICVWKCQIYFATWNWLTKKKKNTVYTSLQFLAKAAGWSNGKTLRHSKNQWKNKIIKVEII